MPIAETKRGENQLVRQVTFGVGDILMLGVRSPQHTYESELWLIQHTPKPKEEWSSVKDERYKSGLSTDDIPVTDLTVALEFTDPDSILNLVQSLMNIHEQMVSASQPAPEKKEPYDSKPLDEKGFVFINGGEPYWIAIYEGNPWLFYWNDGWVTLRHTNQSEIWVAYEQRLTDEQAQGYHDIHAKKFGSQFGE